VLGSLFKCDTSRSFGLHGPSERTEDRDDIGPCRLFNDNIDIVRCARFHIAIDTVIPKGHTSCKGPEVGVFPKSPCDVSDIRVHFLYMITIK
jgi:hypothetical protein